MKEDTKEHIENNANPDKAVAALSDTETIFHHFLLNSPVYVFFKDSEMRSLKLSKNYEGLLGRPLEELLGKNMDDLFPSDLAKTMIEDDKRILNSGNPEIISEELNGRSYVTYKFPISIDGKPIYLAGYTIDVTDQKNAEDELLKSQSLLKNMVENSPMGMHFYELKNDGSLIFVDSNPAADKLLNADNSNFVGKTIQEAFPQLAQTEVPGHYAEAAEKGIIWSTDQIFYQDDLISGAFEVKAYQTSPNKMVAVFSDITERKKTEEALKLSEGRFRSIAENLSDVIFIIDKDGIISYISPSVGLFGYSPDECTGRFFGDFLADGQLEKANSFFTNALHSININSSVSLLFKRKDGTVFFAELTGSDFTVGNNTKGVLGLLRDVSDKMNREIELRKLSSAVEQSQASIVITDSFGNIEYINSKLCDITGYSKEELIGVNPKIMSSGETTKAEYKDLWNTIKAGYEWKGEFHNKKKNGELYWESASISPIKNEKGEITHFLGIKEDITDRKAMEASVVASEQRYRELFLNNPVPTYIFDEISLEFIEVNEATVDKYGFSREEFASMTLKDIRHEEDVADLLESVKKLNQKVFRSDQMRHKSRDGYVFPVEITSHSLPEKNGRKTRLVMVVDITERLKAANQMKLAKEQAEASDKLKTTFLNNISHEVRTPLNGILGFAEIITQTGLTEEDKADSLKMLSESSDRLLHTITSYMDISLITSGSMSVKRKYFILADIFNNIYEKSAQFFVEKSLKLFLEMPEKSETIKIYSDPEIVQKIIFHLIGNAIKFTEKGSVIFGYRIHNNDLEIFVNDTGIGIGNDSRYEIFNRFIKEDRGPSRLSEGSGLGLSIVKGMANLLGGRINVESELDAGSKFSIFFSLIDILDIQETTIPHNISRVNSESESILVAEDDEANFLYLKTILSRETSLKIIHARDGREAIDLYKTNKNIVLILMDIKMAEIDGLEATRQIKLINSKVPVIAITAYAMIGDMTRIMDAGCDGYISKPIRKDSLLKKIGEFIKIK